MRRAARPSSVFALGAALLLGACTGGPVGAPGAPGAPVAGAEIAPGSEGEGEPASAQRAPRAHAAAADADPKRLIGLDHAKLVAMLGDPEFRRRDAPAEFWRYRGKGCMLDLFLYGPEKPAADNDRTLVRHVEARSLGDGPVTTADCLRTLLNARPGRGAG